MKEIITDITKISQVSSKVLLMDENGVSLTEAQDIVAQLTEIMEADKNILALSAPQIGINKRVFCIRFAEQVKAFINPIYKRRKGQVIRFETCESMPGKEIAICRPTEVEISYYNNDVKYEDNKLLGSAAELFEQQYCLLDGIYPGRATKVMNEYAESKAIEIEDISAIVEAETTGDGVIATIESEEDHFTAEDVPQLAQILGTYCDAFKRLGDMIIDSEDKELGKTYKTLRFYNRVRADEVQIINDEQKPEIKMNRAQRRASAKEAKRIERRLAGKK